MTKLLKAQVIGSPVQHSLSPAIFAFLSSRLGSGLQYSRREVKADEATSFLQEVKASGSYIGFNVTLPLKQIAAHFVDELSAEARGSGAVNVIHFTHGKSVGHNTDIFGIASTFRRAGVSPKGEDCLILGAGGAARAVAYYLGSAEAKSVTIFNRSSRGEDLVLDFSKRFPKTEFSTKTPSKDFGVIVNTTPVGMSGHGQDTNFFEGLRSLTFKENAFAFDLIYVPEQTPFLAFSQALGLKSKGGLGMLIDQALATWGIWFSPIQDQEQIHQDLGRFLRSLLKLREQKTPLILTGFMGAGKSAVGKILSELTGRAYFETDLLVEEAAKKKISEIFKEDGEVHFRKLEKEALRAALHEGASVISLGGGALLDPESLDRVLKNGSLVYLKASEAVLEKRILVDHTNRPLMANLSPEERREKIKKILGERRGQYEKASLTVETSELDAKTVALTIISEL